MKKLAFITQSYKNDYKECALLCESMDRFLPKEIDHFIFVNDEDYDLFLSLSITNIILFTKSQQYFLGGLLDARLKFWDIIIILAQ